MRVCYSDTADGATRRVRGPVAAPAGGRRQQAVFDGASAPDDGLDNDRPIVSLPASQTLSTINNGVSTTYFRCERTTNAVGVH